MSSHFVGLSDEESDKLFDEVAPHQYQDDNIYRHDWQKHDLILWDNSCLQHGRGQVRQISTRTLRRVTGNPVPVLELMKHIDRDPRKFTYRKHRHEEGLVK